MDGASPDPAAAAPRDPQNWFTLLFRRRERPAAPPATADLDPLAAFSSESAGRTTPAPPPAGRRRSVSAWTIVGIAATLIATTVAAARLKTVRTPQQPLEGTVLIETSPSGAAVMVDGREHGRAPLSISLPAGTHAITLIGDSERRTVPLTVVAGRIDSAYFELTPRAAAVTTGQLSVTADAPGRVSVDGRPRGPAPAVVPDLAVGEHIVSFVSDAVTVSRKVNVLAGAVSAVAFSFAKAQGPAAGWLTVSSPFDVQVFEGGELVATAGAKVMLPAGRHALRLANDVLGYSDARQVDVAAGKVSSLRVDAPKATLSVNARPWAEVSIDGTDVGQTPLANVPTPIGTHLVVFRHPKLGEQRRTITVTVNGPNRVSADLTGK